jgi:TM2 domain-containing membrane protein YozV
MIKEDDETIIVTDSQDPQKYRIAQDVTGNSKNIRIMTEKDYSSYQAKKFGSAVGRSFARYILLYPFIRAFIDEHPVWRKWVLFSICLGFGYLGIHRFILGKTKSGIIQLVTFGGCSVWYLIDCVRLMIGVFPDSDNISFKDKIKQYKEIQKEFLIKTRKRAEETGDWSEYKTIKRKKFVSVLIFIAIVSFILFRLFQANFG